MNVIILPFDYKNLKTQEVEIYVHISMEFKEKLNIFFHLNLTVWWIQFCFEHLLLKRENIMIIYTSFTEEKAQCIFKYKTGIPQLQ